jgi:hypothetical protein
MDFAFCDLQIHLKKRSLCSQLQTVRRLYRAILSTRSRLVLPSVVLKVVTSDSEGSNSIVREEKILAPLAWL